MIELYLKRKWALERLELWLCRQLEILEKTINAPGYELGKIPSHIQDGNKNNFRVLPKESKYPSKCNTWGSWLAY